MKSIFWRILGAFWLALVLTGALTFLVTRLYNQDSWLLSRHPGLSRLSEQWLEHYRQGQIKPAQQVLNRARREFHIDVQVFAEDGQLLATNSRVRPNGQIDPVQDLHRSTWRRLTQEVVLSTEQNLLFVYRMPPAELAKWRYSHGLGPQALLAIVVLVITLVSLLLTFSITRPLMRLRHAVHELGETTYQQGSLARLASRKDELGVLAADFNRMGQRLQGMLASQRQLLRDVSHELRSPLARLQVGLALAERAGDEQRAELWPRLNLECRRLDGLIDEILTLARVTQQQPEREPIQLYGLLRQLADDARLLAPGQPLQLDCPETLQLHSDARLLQRALDNLLRNALRFSPAGQPVELTVTQMPDGQLQIRVRDHGPGVDGQLLARLAEPFVRANGQSSNGYGLGLTITLRCVEQLGGQLELANHPEGGFVACICLPPSMP
ncbi:MAG: HAMP domain-containing histidine kinase [Gammaproteobacteria bacterium]|nr:HAMP domain-containing histidine kinase [Gammaproteobacteria bacterium]